MECGQSDHSTTGTDYAKAQKEFKQAQDDLTAAHKMENKVICKLGLGNMNTSFGSLSSHWHWTLKTIGKFLSPTNPAQHTSQPAQPTGWAPHQRHLFHQHFFLHLLALHLSIPNFTSYPYCQFISTTTPLISNHLRSSAMLVVLCMTSKRCPLPLHINTISMIPLSSLLFPEMTPPLPLMTPMTLMTVWFLTSQLCIWSFSSWPLPHFMLVMSSILNLKFKVHSPPFQAMTSWPSHPRETSFSSCSATWWDWNFDQDLEGLFLSSFLFECFKLIPILHQVCTKFASYLEQGQGFKNLSSYSIFRTSWLTLTMPSQNRNSRNWLLTQNQDLSGAWKTPACHLPSWRTLLMTLFCMVIQPSSGCAWICTFSAV